VIVYFPNGRDDHRADDNRTIAVMDMVYMPVGIARVVAIPTDIHTNMNVVVPLVPVMVTMMPLVGAGFIPIPPGVVSVAPVISVMAIVTPMMPGLTGRGPPDMRARSRMWFGKSSRRHGDKQCDARDNDTGKYGFKHT
jgi:hypothetical protein